MLTEKMIYSKLREEKDEQAGQARLARVDGVVSHVVNQVKINHLKGALETSNADVGNAQLDYVLESLEEEKQRHKDIKAEIKEWQKDFERREGRKPTDEDKGTIKERFEAYQSSAVRIADLTKAVQQAEQSISPSTPIAAATLPPEDFEVMPNGVESAVVTAELADANATIAQLQQQIQSLIDAAASAASTAAPTPVVVDVGPPPEVDEAALAEKQRLEQQLADTESKLSEAEVTCKALKKEIKQWTEDFKQREGHEPSKTEKDQIRDKYVAYRAADKAVKEAGAAKETLATEVKAANADGKWEEYEAWKAKSDAAHSSEVAQLRAQNEHLRLAVEAASSPMKADASASDAHAVSPAATSSEVEALKATIERLEREAHAAASGDAGSAEDELKEPDTISMSEHNYHVDNLKARIQKNQQESAARAIDLKDTISKLEKALSETKPRSEADKAKDHDAAEDEVAKLTATIEHMKQEAADQKTYYTEQMTTLRESAPEELQTLQMDLDLMKKRLESSEDETEELYAKIETLEKDLEAAQEATMATVDMQAATEELNSRLSLTEELLHAREEQISKLKEALPKPAAPKAEKKAAHGQRHGHEPVGSASASHAGGGSGDASHGAQHSANEIGKYRVAAKQIQECLTKGKELWNAGHHDESFELYKKTAEKVGKGLPPGDDRKAIVKAVALGRSMNHARATGTIKKSFQKFLKDSAAILGDNATGDAPVAEVATVAAPAEETAPVLSEEEQKLKDIQDRLASAKESATAQVGTKATEMINNFKRRAENAEGKVSELEKKLKGASGANSPDKKLKTAEVKIAKLEDKLKLAEAKAEEAARLKGHGAGGSAGAGGGGRPDPAADKKHKKAIEDLQKKLTKEVESAQGKLKKSEGKLTETAEKLSSTEGELKALKRKMSEFEALNKEVARLAIVEEESKTLKRDLKATKTSMEQAEVALAAEIKTSKKLRNEIEDMKGKIRVYARCRPMSKSEKEKSCTSVVSFSDDQSLEIQASRGIKEFSFDAAFPEHVSNDTVFEECESLIQSCLDGYNVCIFAYGQTGECFFFFCGFVVLRFVGFAVLFRAIAKSLMLSGFRRTKNRIGQDVYDDRQCGDAGPDTPRCRGALFDNRVHDRLHCRSQELFCGTLQRPGRGPLLQARA